MKKLRFVAIAGPTASGKTAVSIALAKRIGGQIISCDSIQVYRGLDIGSAKPTLEERQGVPHHMMDVVDIDDADFSVARYRELAEECIQKITLAGDIPIVTGGTGLYLDSLLRPLGFANTPKDEGVRKEIEAMEEKEPGAAYQELEQVDPLTAQRLHPNDKKRIIRALEVYRLSGRPLSDWGNDFSDLKEEGSIKDVLLFGLTMPRDLLYQRIDQRVDMMIQQGLLEEVQGLAGYDRSLPALAGLGYKQLLEREITKEPLPETIERIKRETRRFAKRQITWFKRYKDLIWLDVTQYPDQDAIVSEMERRIREF